MGTESDSTSTEGVLSGRRSDDQPGMREFLAFLRQACCLLMECGCSSNRVELLTQRLGEAWGFEVDTMAIPTGVWISVRRGEQNLVELTRVRSWSVDLDRLARLNDLMELVSDHRLTISEARQRLREAAASEPPYGRLLTLLAGGAAGGALIYGYGGTLLEVVLGLPVGMLVQYLAKYLFVGGDRRYLSDLLCGTSVALYASIAKAIFPVIDMPRLIVGGVIALVPGLVLVNAVHEVAQKNLVSGAAKLLEALAIAASLGCGVAFVVGVNLLFQ